MAENDKDIPVKEQEDGSILAKIGVDENEQFEEENKAKTAAAEDDDEAEGDEAEGMAEGGEVDAAGEEGEEETDDDREKIREARREERKLKKELAKQREASAKHKITALERRNEELARRLAAVENTAASYQFAQLDKVVEDEATRVEYAKMKLLQATQSGDAEGQVEYLDQLAEAKQRLAQAQHYKKQQLEAAKAPKQNVPNPVSHEVQQNATTWLKKNNWFDSQARDTDSRIAKVVDQELVADGWDPSDPEYWDELDSRLSSRLPHRYTSQGGAKKRANPTAGSRTVASTQKAGTITLSRERVQAIKDAGAWDNIEKRNKMIRAYAAYDRSNKG